MSEKREFSLFGWIRGEDQLPPVAVPERSAVTVTPIVAFEPTELALRDLFAAFAISVASEQATVDVPLSARAYEIADAMLKERAGR